MTAKEQVKAEIGEGNCYNCPHWDSFQNYCIYHKIYFNAIGFGPIRTFVKDDEDDD